MCVCVNVDSQTFSLSYVNVFSSLSILLVVVRLQLNRKVAKVSRQTFQSSLNNLIFTQSAYTKKELKIYKSLEANTP